MKKIALFLCFAAVAVLASPQVSAFYDPELDDWIVYALADSGGLYMLRGDAFEKVTNMPGGGPYDVTAFYDWQLDDWIVYAFNGGGQLYRLAGNVFQPVAELP